MNQNKHNNSVKSNFEEEGFTFDCEFCDLTLLYVLGMRIKNKKHILKELENLYEYG